MLSVSCLLGQYGKLPCSLGTWPISERLAQVFFFEYWLILGGSMMLLFSIILCYDFSLPLSAWKMGKVS